MYDETLTGPRELPAYPHHLRGAFYKREAGDTKPCRQRDGAD